MIENLSKIVSVRTKICDRYMTSNVSHTNGGNAKWIFQIKIIDEINKHV